MALDKKKIIIAMCVVICIMAAGYALFSTSLNINGSASISSNWLIEFTKIEEVSKTSGVEILSEPTASGTTATFNVNLKGPGDKIVYAVTVANRGSLDAIVNKINASETGSDAFYFNITGIKQGDELASGQEKEITIEIGYDANVTEQPADPKNKLTMDIEFVQDLNQNIPGEDITINGPTLTTLSGSNSLTLENSAGRALKNYIIKGNSVQNGTPTPTAPVEIESVGEYDEETGKYKLPVEVSGKNMINIEQGLNQSLTTDNNGVYTIAKNDSGRFSADISINLKANTTYVMSYELIDTNSTYPFLLQISWAIQNVGIRENQNYVVFTPTTDITSISIYQEGQMPVGTYTTFKNLQIEEGTVATTYEPYVEPKTYDIYLDEPLRCVGTTCDYIDFEKKEIVRNTRNLYFKVSEMNESENYPGWRNINIVGEDLGVGKDLKISEVTTQMTNINNINWLRFNSKGANGATSVYTISSSFNLTQSQWINEYPNLVVNLLYGLLSPITSTLDLPTISTTEGTSIISVISDNGVSVPIEVEYYKMNES